MLTKIISGGQTGADRGGLEAAVELGLETGGWMPKDFRSEDGKGREIARKFGLREHALHAYPPRTKLNVQESDGTLIFGQVSSPGCSLTAGLCRELDKPLFYVDWRSGDDLPVLRMSSFQRWSKNLATLNVAGNREEKQPGIQAMSRQFIVLSIRGKQT